MASDDDSNEDSSSENKYGNEFPKSKQINRFNSNLDVTNSTNLEVAGWRRVGAQDTMYRQVRYCLI
jgi:hypothetical protein